MIQKFDMVSELINKGQIKLDMTRIELQAILGLPDEEGGISRKYKVPSIYKYGDIQFVFSNARSVVEIEQQRLLYVYVDDSVEDIEEPLFLLR